MVRGGAGADSISVSALDFANIDGGSGRDTLVLEGADLSLDLRNAGNAGLDSVEVIDLSGSGGNRLVLDALAVFDLTEERAGGIATLDVLGDAGDTLRLIQPADQAFALAGQETLDDTTYDVYRTGNAAVRVQADVQVQILPLARTIDLSLLDGGNGFTLTGIDADDQSGYSVSSAGDVNGDGYDDLIIGARRADQTSADGTLLSSVGETYVVYGGATDTAGALALSDLDGANGFILTGIDDGDYAGGSVSSAGDVNGDGYDDLIIGAWLADPNGTLSGETYVVYGGASAPGTDGVLALSDLDGDNGFILNGVGSADGSGRSVSSAGDVNGDGYDDLIISGYLGDPNGDNSGETYVVYGGARAPGTNGVLELSTLNGGNGFILNGIDANDWSGRSVSSAGDVNGDGYDDLIIGAARAVPNGAGSGETYVVYGGVRAPGTNGVLELSTLDGGNGFILAGVDMNDQSGISVSSAGDVNGDGYDDLIIGASSAEPNGNDSGETYVVYGGVRAPGTAGRLELSTLDGANGFILNGIDAGDQSGRSVSSAGDVNGDGYDDLLIGAPGNAPDGDDSGEAYVVYGRATGMERARDLSMLESTDGFVLNGIDADDGAGISVSAAGDVNGDGYDDLLIGANEADPNGDNSGETYLVYGGATGIESTVPITAQGTDDADNFSGNAGADSFTEIATDDVVRGGAGDDTVSVTALDFADIDGGSGRDTLVLAGADLSLDLTGPGNGGVDSVEVIDLSGSGGNRLLLDALAVFDLTEARAGGMATLDVLGDGDDTLELLGGDFSFDSTVTLDDRTYDVYRAGNAAVRVETGVQLQIPLAAIDLSTLDGSNGFTLNGVGERDYSGVSVSSAGDVNGDGYDDLIIGARLADPNGNSSGETYVVYGGASAAGVLELSALDGSNGFILAGIDVNDRSGTSLSSAGDVNGDGYDDLLIGAVGGDPNGNYSGETYVVYGGAGAPGMDGVLDLSDLDGSNGFILNGIDANDRASGAVSSAGDVNGDGYDDLIIGAYQGDPNGNDSGETYVVYGGAGAPGTDGVLELSALDGADGFILNGIDASDRSGRSVASAGDVNGDGYDDLLIGAFYADPNGNESGETYVVYGGVRVPGAGGVLALSTLDGANGFILNGIDASDGSGRSVASAGDVNGDGYDDLIIGVSRADPNGNESGETYVVYGGASAPGTDGVLELSALDGGNGFSLNGIDTGDRSGVSVSSAGDVNGDGYDDLLIGASSAEPNGPDSGETYLVYGGANAPGTDGVLELSTLNGADGFILTGVDSSDRSGSSVSSAGDVNGDGYDDLLIGANGGDPNLTASGETYLVYGGATATESTAPITAQGTDDADNFSGNAGADSFTGIATDDVVRGGAGDDNISVSAIDFADIDGGSGRDTLVLAAADLSLDLRGAGNGGVDSVEVLDLSGTGANTLVLDALAVFDLTEEREGGIATLDVLGDGDDTVRLDLAFALAGQETADDTTFNVYRAGNAAVRVETGVQIQTVVATIDLSTLDGSNGFTLNGVDLSDFSGGPVSSAGDVNGDGYDDLIIGARMADPNGNSSGETYVVYGGASAAGVLELSALDGSNGFILAGIDVNDRSGTSVSSAGDVNGDGYDDLLIGAVGADPNGSYSGETYVVYGGAGAPGMDGVLDLSDLDGSNGFSLNGIDANDRASAAVSSAGDVNGDGYDDLIIGAYQGDPNGDDSGETYVVYGGARAPGTDGVLELSALDGASGFILNGIDASDRSGSSVASAGDVNGDGYDDLLIGAFYADPNGNESGETYVVYGGASAPGAGGVLALSTLDGANGFILNGIDASDGSGRSVASAGDVNGDGYDDLIIGVSRADPNGNESGETYVVYGGASAPGTDGVLELSALDGGNGFSLNGIDMGDRSGVSVSSAGDVNGDGYDDLLIGASSAEPNGTDSGETYLVYGGANAPGTDGVLELFTLDGADGLILTGVDASDRSGSSVSSAGDVNGDGYDDLLIGANGGDPNGGSSGETYLVYGGATGTESTVPITAQGTDDADNFSGNAGADSFTGIATDDVVRGGAGDDTVSVSALDFADIDGGAGRDTLVLAAADLSLDLTAPGNGGLDSVEVIDLSGAGGNTLVLDALAVFDLTEEREGGIATLDVLGDGDDTVRLDLAFALAGQETADGTTFNVYRAGNAAVRVETGVQVETLIRSIDLSTLDGSNGFILTGIDAYDRSGRSVSSAGDVNGDGYDDLIIGASYADPDSRSNAGETYVIYGGTSVAATDGVLVLSDLDGANGFILNGIAADDVSGRWVSSAGDVNGDGYDDLIIGAFRADPNGDSTAGETYVVFGGANAPGTDGVLELSALDGSNGFSLNGIDLGDRSAASVSSAGDVNGDGYDDLIIGAYYADPNGTNSGETYVVYGGASAPGTGVELDLSNLDGSNGFSLNGIDLSDHSGFSVSSAGDVNGDGYDDLIIGAYRADPNGGNSGETYVVYGGPSAPGTDGMLELSALDGGNGFILNGVDANDESGFSVSSAGDVNGDGYDDLIIGAHEADLGGNNSVGETYVVYGGASAPGAGGVLELSALNGGNGFILNGINEADFSGFSVSSAGDVNGDGYDDLIIGALRADPNGNHSGETYVVYGGASAPGMNGMLDLSNLDGGNGFILNGIDAEDYAGRSVSSAGDVNGDGYDDLLIGAHFADPNASNAGETYVIYGGATGTESTARITAQGTNAADNFTGNAGADSFTGIATGDVVRGGAGDDTVSVTALDFADIDGGTGRDTLVLVAADLSLDLTDAGNSGLESVEVIDLSGTGGNRLTLDALAVFDLTQEREGGIATLDLLGDGDDTVRLIQSADQTFVLDGQETADGATYDIYRAGNAVVRVETGVQVETLIRGIDLSTLDGGNGFTLNGVDMYDSSGLSVSSAGDVNGDGYDDLIIGASGADPNGSNSGETYVVYGGASAPGTAGVLELSALDGANGFILIGIDAFDHSGVSVSSAGDVNGDGYDDLIIGANRADPNGSVSGETYVVYGGASAPGTDGRLELSALDGSNGFILNGIGQYDNTGNSVSSAGDVNGDGYDDLIIGAPTASPVGSNITGATYLVYGGPSAPGTDGMLELSDLDGGNGFTLNGIDQNDRAGFSVSSAGDVNGDGYDDLIIGANYADPNGNNPGETYVVYGGASVPGTGGVLDLSVLDGANGFIVNGIDANDLSGRSVSSAGDVNGDGYDDLIIGANEADPNGKTASGEAYVVYGGASAPGMNGMLDPSNLDGGNGFTLNGIDRGDESGFSVSSAGDVNGDGYDDLLIGSPGGDRNAANAANSGETYVVFGGARAPGTNGVLELSTLDGLNGFILTGIDGRDESGASVSSAGDVNGDGYDDLIIGAYRAEPNGEGAGETYVVYGGATGTESTVPVTAQGAAAADNFTGNAGADSFTEIATDDVVRGGPGDDSISVTALDFADIDGGSGRDTLVLAGADLSLDLRGPGNGGVDSVEVIDLSGTGGNTLALDPLAVFDLTQERAGGIATLDVLGDGDDTARLIQSVGQAFTRAGQETADGTTYNVYRAGNAEVRVQAGVQVETLTLSVTVDLSALDGSNGFTLNGIDAGDNSGRSVASAGDVNGDGYDDLIIGAWLADPNGNDSGETYVVYGGASAPGTAGVLELSTLDGGNGLGFTLNGIGGDDQSGLSVSSAGDVNGDGYDDLIIGAYLADPNGESSGETYVVFGGAADTAGVPALSNLDGSNGFILNGIDRNDYAGFSVSSAGDVNGDGYDDLIIGANGADPNESNSGETYVVYGGAGAPGAGGVLELSALDGANGFILAGADAEQSGFAGADAEQSGFSVSSAGDVNGDGYDDLIIGAWRGDPNGLGQRLGQTYVVYGGASAPGIEGVLDLSALDGSNGFILNGIDVADYSGFSVSSAGDVNGDGYDDLIIGANFADPNGDTSGETYVVYGGAGAPGTEGVLDLSALDGSNGFILNGIDADDRSGVSVSSAGDVNGDGYDDLLIGANRADPGGESSAGETYVVYGGANAPGMLELSALDGSNGFTLTGIDESDRSGRSVSSAGDVNGDGYDDLLIGAYWADPNGDDAGETYVIYGGAAATVSTVPVTARGTAAADNFSGNAGADSFTDIATGDVVRGGAGDDSISVSTLDFADIDGGSGRDTLVLAAADLFLDLRGAGNAGVDSVEVVDLSGTGGNTLVLDALAVFDLTPERDGGIATVDVSGDGDDTVRLIQSADLAFVRDGQEVADGTTYNVYRAGNAAVRVETGVQVQTVVAAIDLSRLDGGNGFTLTGIDADDRSGICVSSAGDVNGDGYDDLIIGAYSADPGDRDAGETYVVYGGATGTDSVLALSALDGSNGFVLNGIDLEDYSGRSVSSAGDVNGDGYDDLIIGAYRADPDEDGAGETYVVYGGVGVLTLSDLDGSNGFTLTGIDADDRSGMSVSSAGDVNGDGYDDLIIGAVLADPNGQSSGETYVVYGGSGAPGRDGVLDLAMLDGSNGFTLNGVDESDFSGISVSSAGDVNGDGYDDLIIGANWADPNGDRSGETYVVYGGAGAPGTEGVLELSALDGSNGFILNGIDANDQSGVSVSSAGDVNGDGYDDLIIGADRADSNGLRSGETYLVYGGASAPGTDGVLALSALDGGNGFILSGIDAGDSLGNAVSSAGDVNGDGYDDLIIGAYQGDPNGEASGETYVVYGGATGMERELDLATLDGSNGFVLTGIDSYDYTGRSVSSAGDVNGDGYDDLIIGADGADPNGEFSGETYVIYGGATGTESTAPITAEGTDDADNFSGNAGADSFTGIATGDVVRGGPGDDTISVGALDFADIDGGSGRDTLVLEGSDLSLDLRNAGNAGLDSVEVVDLSGTGGNRLMLDALAVFDLTGERAGGIATLDVLGDADDRVELTQSMGRRVALSGQVTEDGVTYNVYRAGNAEVRVQADVQVQIPVSTIPSFISSATTVDVAENRTLAYTALATDADGDALTYSLSGPDAALFTISQATGEVRFAAVPDFDAPPADADEDNVYDIVVTVSDGTNNVDQAVAITLTDVFDLIEPSRLDGSNGFVLNGIDVYDSLGSSVSSAGDVNGDGYDDLIIGADGADPNGGGSGETYVVYGGAGAPGTDGMLELSMLDGSNGFTLNGINTNDASGTSVSSAGDVNGDGYDDLIIGAYRADSNGNTSAGASYVVYGGASAPGTDGVLELSALDGSNGFVLNGVGGSDQSGVSVSSAGDVNGDGYDDLIIGALGVDTFTGASYVVYGGASAPGTDGVSALDGTNGFILSGADLADGSGYSVSSAGDVNGDGYDDLIIGASRADPNGNESGETYVVYGGARAPGTNGVLDLGALDGTNGFTLLGIDNQDYAGDSVSSAGDVNGDGYDDLIIGASRADPNDITSGETYVVYGGERAPGTAGVLDLSDLDGTNGFILNGVDPGDSSGNAVSSAGDVNGDGYDDLIIGAYSADPNMESSGEAYVLYGGASGPGTNGVLELSTLNGADGFIFIGSNQGDRVGSSVSSAGDVNGDGYDDLLIGANAADPDGRSGAGETYVLYGGATGTESTVPVTAQGTAAADNFTGNAGADSFTDIATGDVVRGGAGDDSISVTALDFADIDGGTGTDRLVLVAADLSLDLTDAGNSGLDSVEVIDLSGTGGNRLTLDALAVFDLTQEREGGIATLDLLGDGDDTVRLIQSADQIFVLDGQETADGTTYDIYQAGNAVVRVETGVQVETLIRSIDLSTLDGSNGFILTGIDAYDRSGRSVSSAGDVNGDGYDDLIIGANYADPDSRSNAGETYVIYGGTSVAATDGVLMLSDLDGANGFILNGIDADDVSGRWVSSAGDVNGDGYDDLIIGAFRADPNGDSTAGETYVVFGGANAPGTDGVLELSALDGSNGFSLNGIDLGDRSAASVSSAGDVNGDGYDDLIIGAYYADPNGTNSGETYVVYGGASAPGTDGVLELSALDGSNGFSLNGIDLSDHSGFSVSSAGDVNGDGYDDLIIGAFRADQNGGSTAGETYVVYGGASAPGMNGMLELSALDGGNGFILNGVDANDESGFSVSSAGDVNGDGYDDLIIGAHEADLGGNNSVGETYVVYGGASAPGAGGVLELSALDGGNGFILNGINDADFSGFSVSSAGDVNGDGYDDLIIGALSADPNGNHSGETYVVYGGASAPGMNGMLDLSDLDGGNGFILNGIDAEDYAGRSVSSAGDVNGDGYDDLLIGAHFADPNASNAGETYVIYGGATGTESTARITAQGTEAADNFTGNAGADSFTGIATGDVVRGGAGDDTVSVTALDFADIDGGTGRDTLVLAAADLSLDLTGAGNSGLDSVEIIDISGTGDNTLVLDTLAVFDLTEERAAGMATLDVLGDAGDSVDLRNSNFTADGTVTEDGTTYNVFRDGTGEVRVQDGVAVTTGTMSSSLLSEDPDPVAMPATLAPDLSALEAPLATGETGLSQSGLYQSDLYQSDLYQSDLYQSDKDGNFMDSLTELLGDDQWHDQRADLRDGSLQTDGLNSPAQPRLNQEPLFEDLSLRDPIPDMQHPATQDTDEDAVVLMSPPVPPLAPTAQPVSAGDTPLQSDLAMILQDMEIFADPVTHGDTDMDGF